MKNLLIVPTRSRPDNAAAFCEAFGQHTTSGITDLLFAVDSDDADNYDQTLDAAFEINDRMGLNGTLNYVASKYCNDYDYISFMGDDHRIRTDDWDTKLISSIGRYGIAYGNDLWQGENLPTAVLLDAEIVRKLGYMAPPSMRHMYLDNFWKDLGVKLGTLVYSPEVIIEHMHYTAGKSEPDALYLEVNDPSVFNSDREHYQWYLNNRQQSDLEKLV